MSKRGTARGGSSDNEDGAVTIEKIIERAKRMNRIQGGLVLCDNCDTPASRSLSEALSWTACAPCALGEADEFDPKDLISVRRES